MSWTLLLGAVFVVGLSLLAWASRRAELLRMQRSIEGRDVLERLGGQIAMLQHPVIDLSRCLGCSTCVTVCPEDGVLDLVHGQAMVINGSRCVGVSACESECPVGAITVSLGDLRKRDDVPVINEELEAVGLPGLFLAGEVTAHALIDVAFRQGAAVAEEVARRTLDLAPARTNVLDLCIIGAGPAGLSCSLGARAAGLKHIVLEQEAGPGGTVAKYPRRKLVLTRPISIPLHGQLDRPSYMKEDLIDLWGQLVERYALPFSYGESLQGIERDSRGIFRVRVKSAAGERTLLARHICLAVGRRGSPRKLGVLGEELSKVAYSLLDSRSYQDRRIIVVGGGDSAVEAALALAEQPGNTVHLAYRKEAFFRLGPKNEARLIQAKAAGSVQVLHCCQLTSIAPDAVELEIQSGAGPAQMRLPNDEVFVMAGGLAPLELLKSCGVSCDPALHAAPEEVAPESSGLVRALKAGGLMTLFALLFALWNGDYYFATAVERAAHPKHAYLRPSEGVGLWMGLAACLLIVVNLAYLLRRAPNVRFNFGSLQAWMTSHIATGLLAVLCALLHGGTSAGDNLGGHAFWALATLLVTGGIGRYFYAYIPHMANGQELDSSAAKHELSRITDECKGPERLFLAQARDEVFALIRKRQWGSSFFARLGALLGDRADMRRLLIAIGRRGRAEGIPFEQIRSTQKLARRAHRAALTAAHLEDLRGLLNTWRYLHRWAAALMVLLVVAHVIHAVIYGDVTTGSVDWGTSR